MSIWIPPDSDFARSLSEPNLATPNEKPTGAVRIDWNHPLTRGLVRAVVSGNQELARNIPIENSGVELTANKFGPEYLYDVGSNDSLVLGESPVSGSQPRTVLSAYRNVDADATYSTLCSIDNGGAGSTAQRWTAWISSGFFRVEIQGTGSTSTLAVDNADNEQTFLGVRQAGSNLSSTTVYINNQSETLTGTTTINTNASYILRVGQTRTDFTDRSLSGGLLWFYFWDRALSELEIAEIKRNPYQILKPANDTPYMFTVAGGGGVSLIVQSANHGHIADATTLVQAHAMTPAEASHAHGVESPTLTQANALSPEETVHGHSAESPALSSAGTLEPAEAVHAHSAESPTILQAHVLVVLDSAHAHTADNVTLTLGGSLDVADAVHGHVVDQPTLTQANAIAPADSTHGHAAESPALTQANSLSPADATHGHAADQPTLDLSVYLSPSEATHAHAADAPTITQANILAVDEALHAHYADSPLLPQDYTIVVSDTLHAHLTASPNLILGTLPLMSGRVYLSRATLRVYRPTKRLNS